MTLAEYLFLAGGASLLAVFALRTIAPCVRMRLETTARKRASDLRDEFLVLPPGKVLLALIASGTVCAALALAAIPDPLWALAAGTLPVLLSGFAVRFFRTKRRKKVISQLPGFLDILAGQIRAGHSMQEALADAIPVLPREIGKEISWVFRFCRLGTPLSEAFLLWEARMPCEEVALLVRPLRVALPAGGNIVDLLERTRDVLRARNRMEEKMRSMTAQARLQAVVLTLLPPGFVFVLSKVDPTFLTRCLGTLQGRAILAGAGILQILGWLTIRKILAARP